MKLAEALVKRKNLKNEIEVLKNRASEYATIQEGNKPLGLVDDVLKKTYAKVDELQKLIVTINRANLMNHLDDSISFTITEALAQRDMLNLKQAILNHVSDMTAGSVPRYGRDEIRMIPTINVEDMRKEADGLGKEYRELDAKIQARNWEIDI